jgi:hypothetical protein
MSWTTTVKHVVNFCLQTFNFKSPPLQPRARGMDTTFERARKFDAPILTAQSVEMAKQYRESI